MFLVNVFRYLNTLKTLKTKIPPDLGFPLCFSICAKSGGLNVFNVFNVLMVERQPFHPCKDRLRQRLDRIHPCL